MQYRVYFITSREEAVNLFAETAETAAATFLANHPRDDTSQITVESVSRSKRHSVIFHYRASDLIHSERFTTILAERKRQEAREAKNREDAPRIARRTKIALTTEAGFMFASAAAVAAGFLSEEPFLVLVGALIYLLCGIGSLFQLYFEAKLLRRHAPPAEAPTGFFIQAAKCAEGAITLTGLLLVIANAKNDVSGYAVAGWIIWGGAIACYFTSGIIAREVGGIPLSMGHGGWAVRRDRKGNLRS